jgi:hypothetical protein
MHVITGQPVALTMISLELVVGLMYHVRDIHAPFDLGSLPLQHFY